MPKISQLDPGSALAGLEMIPDVQSGVTVRTTPSAVATYVLGQLPDLPVEVKDANFEILNSVDTTKVARFSAAAISPATTRSYTLPNANGTLALTSDITQYLPITRQVFASSGTWTRPTGCRSVKVTVVGAGGGSGAVNASAARAGSGGGGGGVGVSILDVTAIASSTIAIGAAGTAGVNGGAAPGVGGTSSWTDGTNTITCTGGGGGVNDTTGVQLAGGAAGTATGGNILNLSGQAGGIAAGALFALTATGGAPALGLGVTVISRPVGGGSVAGSSPAGYGAGATGACTGTGVTGQNGAAGTQGIVIVEEFY